MKKAASLILSSALAFSSLFTATACDSCDHEYGAWKTTVAATCETDGEEKRVCSLCEEEETREIPATGHDNSTIACLDCGKTYVSDDFLQNFTESTTIERSSGVNIAFEPFSFSVTVGAEESQSVYATGDVQNGYAYFGLDADGFLLCYGKLTLVTNNYSEEGQNLTLEKTQKTVASFLVEKDDLYASADFYDKVGEDFSSTPNESGSLRFSGKIPELLKNLPSFFPSAPYGTSVYDTTQNTTAATQLAGALVDLAFNRTDALLSFFGEDLIPFLEQAANAYGVNLTKKIAHFLSVSYDVKETQTGFEVTNKSNVYTEMLTSVKTLTLAKLLDRYVGPGTFAALENLPAFLDKTVGEIFTDLETHGVTTEILTALANKALLLLKVQYGGAQATLERYGIDLNQIKTAFADVKLSSLLKASMQEIGLTYEQFTAYYNSVLALLKSNTLVQIMQLSGIPAQYINQALAQLQASAALQDNLVKTTFVTDKTGKILSYSAKLNKDAFNEYFESTATAKANVAIGLNSDLAFSCTFGAANQDNATDFNAEAYKQSFEKQTA